MSAIGGPGDDGDLTTAVVTRAPSRDAFGDPVALPAVRRHLIEGCLLAPGNTTEEQERADTVASDWTLYAPPGADLHALDVVLIGGIVGEVIGDPRVWPAVGVIAALRRVTG